MNVVFLLMLGFLMHATRTFSPSGTLPGSSGVTLALGYVLLTAFFAGRVFKGIRLPKLTGYLLAGVVVGPDVLGFVTPVMLDNLSVVNGMAVALIAMTAGTELELRAMRPLFRTIAWISLLGVVGTFLLLAVTIFLARGMLPFLGGLTGAQAGAVALVLAAVAVAQSPAVVVALRDEVEAEGPVSRVVLGVVVLADLLVILMFALASTLAKGVLGRTADVASTLAALGWELPGSLVVGAVLGLILAAYFAKVEGGHGLFLLTVAFVIAEVGARIHFDPLLIALAAGMVVRNATRFGDELHARTETAALPVYILFFAVAGASLHLDALAMLGIPALLIVLVRGAGILVGSRAGAAIAGAPAEVRRFAGFGLLPQAGLALALSLLFARTFPEFGDEARALLLGVVATNELVAPVLYRWALVRAGEAGRRAPAGSAPPEAAGVEPA